MSVLRLGTRGSRLATAQSSGVARALEAHHPGLSVELVEIRTSGDRIQDVPLGPHLGQAFFTREIQDALIEGRVDLAVHSCKDLATVLPPGTRLAAIPAREDVRDALVSARGGLDHLPAGARVGTSSPRRRGFLLAARPDVVGVDLRGNVPTRVAAVEEGRMDATVLAMAGLRRLGLEGCVTEALDPEVMLPAAAQGALALEVRADDARALDLVAVLDDADARAEVTAERACLRRLEAGCQAPVGALARVRSGEVWLRAAVVGPEGPVRVECRGPASRSDALGEQAARELLARLGLATLRDVPWAGAPPAGSGAGGAPPAGSAPGGSPPAEPGPA
ncbi:MAG: hydroxymethylbilane synthase [Longimicrobiales bacterium]|nr:hydroxymethylbilane synthase [Longimicrobiales bacterium]